MYQTYGIASTRQRRRNLALARQAMKRLKVARQMATVAAAAKASTDPNTGEGRGPAQ